MSEFELKDTICAISTPIGEGGISIVRVSGKDAFSAVDSIFRAASGKRLMDVASHTIHYGHIVVDSKKIDEVLVSVFRTPRSFTAEDVIEINSHGGVVMTDLILRAVLKQGVRLAQEGEFTKRAFLNGRIDLAQAEAVIDIIKSKSERSAKTALEQLQGTLSSAVNELKNRMIKILAHIESFIDFPEEENELFDDSQMAGEIKDIDFLLKEMLATYRSGEYLREGVHTVMVGRPNAGKSSLLNALLRRDRAIVSSYPGTTRDALEEMIEIDGVAFRLVDTAGIMPSPEHELDYLSIEQTKEHVTKGDLLLFMIDSSVPTNEEDRDIFEHIKDKDYYLILNKTDLPVAVELDELLSWGVEEERVIKISVSAKKGLEELEAKMSGFARGGEYESKGICILRARHRDAIERAASFLSRAGEMFQSRDELELIACEVRSALKPLQELIGEVYSDDVLNHIFDEFCIGK